MSDDIVVTNEVGEHVSRRRSLSRRDMIKRTAVAGAAVAWAVPVVEVLGSRVASASSATTSITSGAAVSYTFGVTNFGGDTIQIDFEVGGTPEHASYNVAYADVMGIQSASVTFDASNSTVSSDPFGLSINSTATIISGSVPVADTAESVTVTTVYNGTGKFVQTANGGDPISIVAVG